MIISPKAFFQSNSDKVKFVEAFLSHPYGQEALLVLAGEGTPIKPSPVAGVDYAAQVAISGAESSGFHRALFSLKSLAVLPPQEGQAEEENYGDIARKEMIASGLYTEEDLKHLKTQPTQ